MGPSFEKKEIFFKNYQLLDNFFSQNKFNVVLKPHPMSDIGKENFTAISIASKDQTMESLCKDSFAVISIYSNAIMDAACLGLPIIYFNATRLSDEWMAKSYFGICTNEQELNNRISKISKEYSNEIIRASSFGTWHLGEQGMGTDYIANILTYLVLKKTPISNTVHIKQRI